MDVKYRDIRENREYVITGHGPYIHWPNMIVRVLNRPPIYSSQGNFYPTIQVRVLQVLNTPNPDPNPSYMYLSTPNVYPGETLTLNWRSNFWTQPWHDYGLNWTFKNVVLEPLPANIQAKTTLLNELKAVPSYPHAHGFPGGTDFLTLASHQASPVTSRIEGGLTFYRPQRENY
jgi:hypothetical protein